MGRVYRPVVLAAGCTLFGQLTVRTKPLKADVVSAVTQGSGVMLSFQGTLSATQIQAVADFVSRNAGR